jgi:hypothetical protein
MKQDVSEPGTGHPGVTRLGFYSGGQANVLLYTALRCDNVGFGIPKGHGLGPSIPSPRTRCKSMKADMVGMV